MTRQPKPVIERLMAKVEIDSNGCWIWQGAKTGGYGVIGMGPRGSGTRNTHRVAYEHHKGPIPEGLVLDHLCRNPPCCNPDHLEAVPQQVNVDRGLRRRGSTRSECRRGHAMTAENVVMESGHRVCRTCYEARLERKRVKVRKPPKTHCKRGHEFTPENTYDNGRQRTCRECARMLHRKYYHQKKNQAAPVAA